MMNAKGFAALLSICMLAALPACCGWKGCGKKKCEETREDGYSRREEKQKEYKEPKTKRTYKSKTVSEASDM
jgi:hypothetical protein